MHKLSSLSVIALVTALTLASPVFAATPKFVMGAPGTALDVDDFASQLAVFNGREIRDLLHARTVTVYSYNNAWTSKSGKAVDLLGEDAQSIDLLRKALDRSPAAIKLLAANKIKVNQVVDIVDIGNSVQLYIQ